MNATAISKSVRATCPINNKGRARIGVKGVADLKRVINKWPAIMFAVRRIARVPGRIMFLTVSIITIKGIKIVGVPCGIRWANKLDVLFSHPNNIIANQAGRAMVKVKTRCLEAVKI